MFGLLGPNGAGKSTLMRIIATLQEPDAGTVDLGDIDVLREKDAVRRMLGYLPQEFGLYPKVTAEACRSLRGAEGHHRRARAPATSLTRCSSRRTLATRGKQKLGAFSGGMRQRFGIAVALLGKPKLIIVDEPTAGLDPAERVRFLNLLAEIGEEVVVILSTHIVDDVSDLCSRMAIIDRGEIRLEAEPAAAIAECDAHLAAEHRARGARRVPADAPRHVDQALGRKDRRSRRGRRAAVERLRGGACHARGCVLRGPAPRLIAEPGQS